MGATASLCRIQTTQTECINWNYLDSHGAKILFSTVKDDCQWKHVNQEGIERKEKQSRAAVSPQLVPAYSPFCTSLLLWGRTFPRRFLVRTELSGREDAAHGGVRLMPRVVNKDKVSQSLYIEYIYIYESATILSRALLMKTSRMKGCWLTSSFWDIYTPTHVCLTRWELILSPVTSSPCQEVIEWACS